MKELVTHRLIGAVSLALVAAAILAGGAQADRPDDRAGMLGVGGTSSVVVSADRPDDRAGVIGVGGTSLVASPDAFERAVSNALPSTSARPDDLAGARGPGVLSAPPLAAAATANDRIEWGDARLGIATALGALLLAGALAVQLKRRARPILP